MSSIGSVGLMGGLGALGGGLAAGGVSSVGTGGLNGPVGDLNAATVSAMSGTRMDQLLELMDGFSSAEILIALMLSGSSGKRRDDDSCGSAAMGFLLGMAMASQLGQGLMSPMSPAGGIEPAMTGGAVNLTA